MQIPDVLAHHLYLLVSVGSKDRLFFLDSPVIAGARKCVIPIEILNEGYILQPRRTDE
jgi:hypothetical protein